jgi:hypothetical protein
VAFEQSSTSKAHKAVYKSAADFFTTLKQIVLAIWEASI